MISTQNRKINICHMGGLETTIKAISALTITNMWWHYMWRTINQNVTIVNKNLFSTETEKFGTMAAGVPAPCVARPSAHIIEYTGHTGPCFPWGRVWTTRANSVLRIDRKCLYIFMFPQINSAQQGFIIYNHQSATNQRIFTTRW